MISFNKIYPQSVLKHTLVHFQGIGMKIILKKTCQNMFKKLISIYHQLLSTISFKTFTGSFSRYWNENLFFKKKCQNMFKKLISIINFCPQSGLKHSLVHFQGIGMKFYFIFSKCQNAFKTLISIINCCPQSVLKHSLVHFQGIGMKIILKKNVKICSKN